MNEVERAVQNKKNFQKRETKKAVKLGTVSVGIVETTPFVWEDRLYYFCWDRKYPEPGSDEIMHGCYSIKDAETDETVSSFADEHSFGAIYVENGKAYVIGTPFSFGGSILHLFVSDDLVHWEQSTIFSDPAWTFYNTSICKGADGYICAAEISAPAEYTGVPYTIVFFRSDDLLHWEMLDPAKYVYTRERYSACPVIRYVGGYYYMIYLAEMPDYCYVPYIIRSTDLLEWDPAPVNPVMFYDENDRKVIHPERFTEEQLALIRTAVNTNNSDVDLCEWQGKTHIFYSWGNQLNTEFLARAEFDGTMQEYFESFY